MLKWPLFETISRQYDCAGIEAPSRPYISLLDIADEHAAEELIVKIVSCARSSSARIGADAKSTTNCLTEIFSALEGYQFRRDWSARQKKNAIERLRDCRDADLKKEMANLLKNPNHASFLLGKLDGAIRKSGTFQRTFNQRESKFRCVLDDRGWQSIDVEFVNALLEDKTAFRQFLDHVDGLTSKAIKGFDLVRRLRDLGKSPTSRRLEKLIADGRKADGDELEVLDSALRVAARRTIFKDEDLPDDWLVRLGENTTNIRRVAKAAHRFLLRGLPGQGAVRDYDFERYCEEVAQAYEALTGKPISYNKATETSLSQLPGQAYGLGREFMWLAMRLVDGAVTINQAQREIDRIRNWSG